MRSLEISTNLIGGLTRSLLMCGFKVLLYAGLSLALVACASPSPARTFTPEASPTPPPPTILPSATIAPSNSPRPPTDITSPTTTSTPDSDCFQVEFVEDVTVTDGALMRPGEIFLKIWRLANTGQCAWEGTLVLVFEKGVPMRSPDETPANLYSPASGLVLNLGERDWVDGRIYRVEPGQTVDVAVVLQAPLSPGLHRTYFLLLDPFGQRMYQLYAVVEVREDQSPGEWSGQWTHRMPSFLEGEDTQLFLDQSGRDLVGFFYLDDGRLLLLSGRISEDGLSASGLWGEPWTAGSQFEWHLAQPDLFRGSFLSSSMPEGLWCAVRGELTLGESNCLLEEP